MPKPVSGKTILTFLSGKGFVVYSWKSSHVKMVSEKRGAKTIIPMHKDLATGTLRAILRQSKLSDDEKKEFFEEL